MNRTMEAKRIKYIRQSRARPRTLRMNNGHQKVPQSVDRSKIPQEYLGLFAYRERAKGFIDAYLEALFPSHSKGKNPDAIISGDAFKLIPPNAPAKDAFLMCKLKDSKYVKTTLFFNTVMTCFFFVEYQVLPCVVRLSCTYNDHDRALEVFHRNAIRWIECISTMT